MRAYDSTYDVFIDDHAEGEDVLYAIDWTDWLRGATIVTSDITPGSVGQLTLDNSAAPDEPRGQLFRAIGGAAGDIYDGVATITTSEGDTLRASVHIEVVAP